MNDLYSRVRQSSMTKRINQLITGALFLTVAGLISKVLSAMYRIPLQNLTGDLGFYTYQQIYPLIATVTILSLYGFPMAVSRLTAERRKQGQPLSYRYYFIPLFLTLLFINGMVALLLFLGAPTFAKFMYDEHLTVPIQLSSLLFLLIPFIALFRGVFQGELQMKQTAYSHIVEQFVRVTFIIVSAWFIFIGSIQVRYIAELGVLSSMAGMITALIVLAILFIRSYPLYNRKELVQTVNKRQKWYLFIGPIVVFGLLAALNHLTLIFVQTIDVFTLVPQLIKSGLTPTAAMEQKGVYDRGIPLIQFGAVLGSSFALAFIPSVDRHSALEQKNSIRDAFSISVYLSLGATVGLITLYEEVNRLLFMNDAGTSVLQILALAIFLLSISITGNAILQAYGYISWTLVVLVISLIMKILLNYILIPLWGTSGSAIATIASLLCLTLLTIGSMVRFVAFSPWKGLRFWPMFGASTIMAGYLFMVKGLVSTSSFSRTVLFIYVLFLVVSGAFIYFLVLLRYEALHKRQIEALPFQRLLLKLQKSVQKR